MTRFPELVPQEEIDATKHSVAMLAYVLVFFLSIGAGALIYGWMHTHNEMRLERPEGPAVRAMDAG